MFYDQALPQRRHEIRRNVTEGSGGNEHDTRWNVLMATGALDRPQPRASPDDFDAVFIVEGRVACEAHYRARRDTVTRWLTERGKKRLIKARADYVADQRARGLWITRSTRMIEHREVPRQTIRATIRDKRKVSLVVARHAAQHLRIMRNGGMIVSPAGDGEWWVGSKRLSAAQMVDLAVSRGFEGGRDVVEHSDDDIVKLTIKNRRDTAEQRKKWLDAWTERMRDHRLAADIRLGIDWQGRED